MTVLRCLLKCLNLLKSCLHLTMVCQSCFIESLSGRLWLRLVYQRITAGKQIQKQIRNSAMWVILASVWILLFISKSLFLCYRSEGTRKTWPTLELALSPAPEQGILQKRCYFRVFQPALSRMSRAPRLPRVPRLEAATKDENWTSKERLANGLTVGVCAV